MWVTKLTQNQSLPVFWEPLCQYSAIALEILRVSMSGLALTAAGVVLKIPVRLLYALPSHDSIRSEKKHCINHLVHYYYWMAYFSRRWWRNYIRVVILCPTRLHVLV